MTVLSFRHPIVRWIALVCILQVVLSCIEPVNQMIASDSYKTHLLKQKTWLALGDSYTIGESVQPQERYAAQSVAMLKTMGIQFSEPELIASTGWTTTDLLGAIAHKNPAQHYDIVTLLIGVNNQYQGKTLSEYQSEFRELLEKAIQFAGNQSPHVIVLSIPDYAVTPFANNLDKTAISKEIDAFNAINKQESGKRLVHYLNVTPASRESLHDPSLVAEDGLHFSGKEYEMWAEELSKIIRGIVE